MTKDDLRAKIKELFSDLSEETSFGITKMILGIHR